jgi:DNA replication and repair protein RecF
MGEVGRQEAGAGLPWAVAGRFETLAGPMDIGTGTDPEGATERRIYRLDGQALRSQAMLAERMAAVWITPQMDRLFQEGASGRRRFLDRLVWALEPGHAREVAAHDNAMAERNRLLAEGRADPAWLAGLEDAMARHAVAVAAARRALMLRLNAELAAGRATGAFPAARLEIACPILAALSETPALAVEDALRQGLAADRRRDAAGGGAARGAHKADLSLIHMPKSISAEFCSTGEQKALLVSVVLAHAALIAEARGFAPLLLLDEVAAHLDPARREALFAALAALPAQVFMTGTDLEVFTPLAGLGRLFSAGDGKLIPVI